MKVLVTGAFGTLGMAACRELSRRGHNVAALDLKTGRNRKLAVGSPFPVRVFWGDIRDPAVVEEATSGCDALVHAAAILAPTSEKDPALSREVNVEGTRNVVEVCRRTGARLVYPSSVTVFGPGRLEGPLLSPRDPVSPTDHYSSHKVECEEIIQASGLEWSILRLGVSIDPSASRVSREALEAMFEISPDTRMEYVHPSDAALAMVNALERPEAWGKVLLIGGGARCRIRQRDLFDAVFSAAGVGTLPPKAFGREPYYTDWMDTSHSQAILDYQRHTFDDFRVEAQKALRFKRPLVTMIRPLVRSYLLGRSRPWRERKKGD